MDDKAPLVTVKCLAYNHEKYIRDTLEGFVRQKTDFPFEVIVHDDASTDGTADIIREYAEKYPHIITPILETENQYSKHDGSLRRIMNAVTRGKYIAHCEADDYWTDPQKLQKQVDFLEAHPDYTMSFHNAIVHHENGSQPDHLFAPLETRTYHWRENVDDWIVPTASIIHRASVTDSEFYKAFSVSKKFLVSDNPLVRTCGMLGKLYCFSEPMSVYRLQPTGWTQRLNPMMTYKLIEQEIEYKRIFGKEHYEPANRQIAMHSRAAVSLLAKGHIKESFRIWGLALRHAPWLVTKANIKFAYNLLRHKTME